MKKISRLRNYHENKMKKVAEKLWELILTHLLVRLLIISIKNSLRQIKIHLFTLSIKMV
jgi:hypothetical protein